MDYKKHQYVCRVMCRLSRWGYNKKEQYFGSLADLIPSPQPPTGIAEDMQITPECTSPAFLLLPLCPPSPSSPKDILSQTEHSCFFHFSSIFSIPEESPVISYRISFYEYFHLEVSNNQNYYSVKKKYFYQKQDKK